MTDTGVRTLAVIGEAEGAVPLADLMGAPLDAQVPVDLDEHILVLPYSSGTTGLPKGVMLSHRNLVANVDQTLPGVGIEAGDLTPMFLPFFHIYGLHFQNVYLSAGGGMVTMPRFDLEQFLALTERHRARRLWIVPPVAIALAKHPIVERFDLSSVQSVLSGAAPLGADVGEALAEAARLRGAARLRDDRDEPGQPCRSPVGAPARIGGHRGSRDRVPDRRSGDGGGRGSRERRASSGCGARR
jgi:acyl-CoA synthetase (AMP-forming)/AMP-acid ligase II